MASPLHWLGTYMLARWFTLISFLSFGALSLFVIEMTRRPLCIESRVVERIDRLQDRERETIYRCAVNKVTPFSPYFNAQMKDLTHRVQRIERVLESIEPFGRKVQVTVVPDRPLLFQVQGHQIYIGQNLLEAPGHLEKALAKIWYRERNQSFFVQQALLEEVVTDFLVHLDVGDIDIGDPATLLKTALHPVKWPYVIKSVPAYCESPWKQSEHFALCQNKDEAAQELSQDILEMSLRPLLATSWIRAYRELSLHERFQFIRSLPMMLRSEHLNPLPITMSSQGVGFGGTMLNAAEAIRNLNQYVSLSPANRRSETFRVFVSHFTNELQSAGFQEAFAEASFDVLYVIEGSLNDKSGLFRNILKLAKAHPGLQMALRDNSNLWMLPSRYPIPLKSFGEIRAQRTVVQKCGGYNFSYVMDYAEVTEKLLVVEHCNDADDLQYTRYLREGAEGFGAENKGVAFVQFHLPSLLMKRSELESVANVFEFIQKRDVESPSFSSLGWQAVQWSERAQAYQPKAFVDAIEWFRIPNDR